MKIHFKRFLAVTVMLIFFSLLLFFCFPSLSHNLPAPLARTIAKARNRAQPLTDRQRMFLESFKTPIELYGRVEDQNGIPVADATVTLSPINIPWGEYSKGETTRLSDANGEFHINGLHGTSMGVGVKKEGYLTLDLVRGPGSHIMVDYSGGAKDGQRHSHPETPLVLRLHKVGPTEPLVYIDDRWLPLPVDGTPKNVALDDLKGNGPHQIEFRFNTGRVNIPSDNEHFGTRYDWSFEARIRGGGFVWSDNVYDSVAPASGYNEIIRLEYKADMPVEQWQKDTSGSFFIRFNDGCHGRILLEVDGTSRDGDSPIKLESWLNTKPGSRNLATTQIRSTLATGERYRIQWK